MRQPTSNITEEELRALHKSAWGWARSVVSDMSLADDVMQDVYTMILDGRAQFDQRSTLKTWLYGVIRNVGLQHLKQQKRHVRWLHQRQETDASQAPEQDTLHAEISQQQRHQLVYKALTSLPTRQRELLELVIFREFTLEQSAQILNVSIGTARTHYHRGKASVKSWLEQNDA